MHVTGFNWSVSDSIINWSVSVSIFVFRFGLLLRSISSLKLLSKLRSLERGGVSELSQAQVDR
jgi:hypothetical protein